MSEGKKHWTEDDVESYVYRIAFDFVTYVGSLLKTGNFSQAELAHRLGVSEGRVSQILNDPGNLTLKQVVKIARALDRKVSIVAYDDNDPGNANGPIAAGVFAACWERAGKPVDFFALGTSIVASGTTITAANLLDSQSIISFAAVEGFAFGATLPPYYIALDQSKGFAMTTFAGDTANSYSQIRTGDLVGATTIN